MKSKQLTGVTWSDVDAYLEDLETSHDVMASIIIERQPKAWDHKMGLRVTLRVTGWRRSGSEGFTRTVKASWPTYGHKTMPGLLLYLVHAAHESLLANRPQYHRQGKTPSYREG